ncbi:hypothetical protein JXB28_01375 [Candidatus Woesearchaeota archaeon]|nr:hypothetical protein [Candidatus Woesearchaeota archaeon]
MTLILGRRIEKPEAEKESSLDDYLVMVADSMASYAGKENHSVSKEDRSQKMYVVGEKKNFLIMGTGRGDMIRNVALSLYDANLDSLKEASDAILEITDGFDPGDTITPLNFIVGGNYVIERENRRELGFAHVVATVVPPDQKASSAEYRQREGSLCYDAVDGSGAIPVMEHKKKSAQFGKDMVFDLADVLVELYEQGKAGAQDTGVNDKLQFGIINKNSASTIYHPDIWLVSSQHFDEYLTRMAKITLPEVKPEDVKGHYGLAEMKNDVKKVLTSFYDAWTAELRELSELRQGYTQWADAFGNDEAKYREGFEAIKARRQLARRNVLEGANALVTKGLEALVSYTRAADIRKRAIESKLLGNPEKPIAKQ